MMVSSSLLSLTVCFCVFGLAGLLVLVMLAMAIRIVPAQQRLTVFRMGQPIGERGPGLVILMPFIDRGVLTDVPPVSDQTPKS